MPVVSMEAGAAASNSDGLNINSREVEYKDVSVVYRNPVPSYAERVLLTYNEDDAHLIKVLLRQTRYFYFFKKRRRKFCFTQFSHASCFQHFFELKGIEIL